LWTLLVLVTGFAATVVPARDTLSSARIPTVPFGRRLVFVLVTGIPCAAQVVALLATIRSPPAGTGIFPELAILVVPVSLFLVLASFGLLIGAVLSWPFRGMLRAHTVAGAAIVFFSLTALARGDDPNPLVTGLFLFSGLLAALGSRWIEGQFPREGEQEGAPSGEGESPAVNGATASGRVGNFPAELAEKYEPVAFLGSGGLAHVYRAIDRASGREVALKIPLRSDEVTGKSFLKEIRGWEGLSHPHIVKVYEANILPVPYLEMEYIGRTLADMEKPLPVREAARICRDICRGLAYAHAKQVIHRDIKPHNILVTGDGIPKISDWGMSKVMDVPGMPTVTGFSLAYAAPEQLSPGTFGETDARTDIYQLGCVLYELLTGRVPFPGTDAAAVTAAILSSVPPRPSEINPAAEPLDGIVMKCLEKRPADRYQSAAELERDLDAFLSRSLREGDLDIFEDP
ncbi:MAG: serine/threonine-protein kinase, partial [Methanolinea sp.]